jgi:sulfate/thiosulfate-binding protein
VIDGLEADVVTLGIPTDVDAIANAGLIAKDWVKRLPQDSTPYTSTIVFLVRKGNPKGIKDWGDLAHPGVSVVTPNPKTSSGGQMAYLAAFGWALDQFGGDTGKAKAYIGSLYKNVPVLDSGARGSTVTFTQRGVGDVLLAWENEAFLAIKESGADQYEIVVPPESVLAPAFQICGRRVHGDGCGCAQLRAPFRRWSVLPGFGPALGFTLTYLSLIVLIPLLALFLKASQLDLTAIWTILTNPRVSSPLSG